MKKLVSMISAFAILFLAIPFAQASENLRSNLESNPPSIPQANSPFVESGFEGIALNAFEIEPHITSETKEDDRWNLVITSKVTPRVQTVRPINFVRDLYKLSEDKSSLVSFRGNNRWITSHKAQDFNSFQITENLSRMPVGHYKEVILGYHYNENGTLFKGYREIYFRVTNDGVHTGWIDQAAYQIPALQTPAKPLKSCKPDKTHHRELRIPGGSASQVTLTGQWLNTHRDKSKKGLNHARIEVWYLDCTSDWNQVAISHTDAQGRFAAMYRTIDDAIQWKVMVHLDSNVARVENKDKRAYSSLRLYDDLSNGGNIGDIEIPTQSIIQEATWLFDDIMRFRDFHSDAEYALPSEKAVINYGYGEQVRTAFFVNNNLIHIEPRYVKSPNTTLHELAHFYMYNQYGKWKAPGNCDEGEHIYYGATDTGCGWEEGWAHFVSAVVNGSSVFIYDDDMSFDMEHTQTYQPHGDKVEGRVSGALWDLYDLQDDGLDTRNYPYSMIYKNAFIRKVIDFSWYWISWKFSRYPLAAKYSINQNGIMYDEDVFLEVGKPQMVNDTSVRQFAIRGEGAVYTIETKMHQKPSKPKIELYRDVELNDMMSSNHHTTSNPYPSIRRFYLAENKIYYVTIQDVEYDQPVYAELNLHFERKQRDVDQSPKFAQLLPNTEAQISGEIESWFQIKGNGQYATFEVSSQQEEIQAHLQLYVDDQQSSPLIKNDDMYIYQFRKINRIYLAPGKTYYLKVRNHYDDLPILAEVKYHSSEIGNELPILTEGQPHFLNGEVEKLFVIQGTGNYYDIVGSSEQANNRPDLELFYDIDMDVPVPILHWDKFHPFARYNDLFLVEGITYYVRVKHEVHGLPVHCKISISKKV